MEIVLLKKNLITPFKIKSIMTQEKEESAIPSPRREIEKLIEKGDLKGLLYKAAELHGQLCPYLAYGVMAGYTAIKE